MTPTTELVPIDPRMEQLITMVVATCISPRTKRVYGAYLRDFIQSGYALSREGVALYLQSQRASGVSEGTIACMISPIRKLAAEANMRGLLSYEDQAAIASIRCGKIHRTRTGMWLTLAQVKQLLALPDRTTYWGKRDACLLSLLVGCGLRRTEMAILSWDSYQSREGRMCLVDFWGKGNKLRTVPVPLWAQIDVDMWSIALRGAPALGVAGQVKKRTKQLVATDTLVAGGISHEAIMDLVNSYGERMGIALTPHDLRRTLAQLLRRNGAPLEQIQYTLGHDRLQTTSIYLGSNLEFGAGLASVDKLALGEGQ